MADDATAKFTVDLAVEGTPETTSAREEVEKLRASVDKNSAALGRMRAAYRNLKVGGLENSEQAKVLKARIDATRKSIGETQSKLIGMRGGLGDLSTQTVKSAASMKAAATSTTSFAEGLQAAGGPVASLSARVGSLTVRLSKAGVAGAALAAVAAIVALDAIAIKATVTMAKMAATAADAYRSENLALQGMTKAWVGWWGQIKAGKADDVQAAIDEVSSSVTLGRDKVHAYAEALYRSRLRGQALKDALMGVSMAASAAGDEFGEVAKNQVVSAAMWGQSVKGMADNLKNRFGSIVQKQMLSLPVQFAKAREGLNAMFRGIKVEPLLRGLQKVLVIFDQGTVQFKAWKQIFESLFNPLFAGAERGGEVFKNFVDNITIVALRAAIAWEGFAGSARMQAKAIQFAADSMHLVIDGMASFAVATLRGTQALIMVADVIMVRVRPAFDLLSFMLAKSRGDVKGAAAAWSDYKQHLADFAVGRSAGASNGIAMIEGIVEGIQKAQPILNSAVTKAAKDANETFRREQDIHSPSRVWGRFGIQLPRGAAVGVRAGIPEFRKSVRDLATIPEAQPDRSTAAPMFSAGFSSRESAEPRRAPTPVQVTIQEINIPQAAANAPGTVVIPVAELRSMLASILEGAVIQAGGRL